MSISTFFGIENFQSLFFPVAISLCGILAGLVLEKIVRVRIKNMTRKTPWEGDEIIIDAFKGLFFTFASLLGVYVGLKSSIETVRTLDAMEKIFTVAWILLGTVLMARILSGWVKMYSQRFFSGMLSTSILDDLTKTLVFLMGTLMVLESLNISIAPILTALGIGGLAVALALQDTLANLFAGIHILVSRQIKPGDYIKLSSGTEGFITDITWRYSHIKALSNNITIVPNAELAKATVTNFEMPEKEMAVLVEVGVSYDSDLGKVEAVTCAVAKETMHEVEGGVNGFDPFIRFHTFGDSSINFTVILRCKQFTDQYIIKHEFVKRLHRRYEEEGIQIPFPMRTIRMAQAVQIKHPIQVPQKETADDISGNIRKGGP